MPRDNNLSLDAAGYVTLELSRSFGLRTKQNQHPNTLRGIVYNLRNSVAQIKVESISNNKEVKGFTFRDRGFEATIDIAEVKIFVEKLAKHLEKQIKE